MAFFSNLKSVFSSATEQAGKTMQTISQTTKDLLSGISPNKTPEQKVLDNPKISVETKQLLGGGLPSGFQQKTPELSQPVTQELPSTYQSKSPGKNPTRGQRALDATQIERAKRLEGAGDWLVNLSNEIDSRAATKKEAEPKPTSISEKFRAKGGEITTEMASTASRETGEAFHSLVANRPVDAVGHALFGLGTLTTGGAKFFTVLNTPGIGDALEKALEKHAEFGQYLVESKVGQKVKDTLGQNSEDLIKWAYNIVPLLVAHAAGKKVIGKTVEVATKTKALHADGTPVKMINESGKEKNVLKTREYITKLKEMTGIIQKEAKEGKTTTLNSLLTPENIKEGYKIMEQVQEFKGKQSKPQTEPIPSELINSQKGAEVFTELDVAKAKERIFVRDEQGYQKDVIGVDSTFPDWIPDGLRTKKLVDQVKQHLINDTIPEKQGKVQELYDVVHERLKGGEIERAPVSEVPTTMDAVDTFNQITDVINKRTKRATDKEAPRSMKGMDTSAEIKKILIYKAKESAKTDKGKAITEQQSVKHWVVETIAKDMGQDVKSLKALAAKSPDIKYIAIHSKMVLEQSASKIKALADEISQNADSWSGEILNKKMNEFDQLNIEHDSINLAYREITAELGRGLKATQALSKSVEALKDKIVKKATVAEIKELAKEMSGEKPIRVLNRETQTSWGDVANFVQQQGLLSGPFGRVRDFASGIAQLITTLPDKMFAITYNKLESLIKRKPSELFYDELRGYIGGTAEGIMRGSVNGLDSIIRIGDKRNVITDKILSSLKIDKEGIEKIIKEYEAIAAEKGNKEYPNAIKMKGEQMAQGKNSVVAGGIKKVSSVLGDIFGLPGKVTQATDNFYGPIFGAIEKNMQAIRQAHNEGLKGAQLKLRIQELTGKEPLDMKQLKEVIERGTFQKDLGHMGKAINSLRSHPNPWVRFAFKTLIPFIKTMSNAGFQAFIERTPLAILSKGFKDDFAAGGKRRAEAIGRMTTGTLTIAATAQLTMAGRITGYGPSNEKERNAWYAAGNKPFTFTFPNGQKFSYLPFLPLALLIGSTATVTEQWENKGEEKTIEDLSILGFAFAKTLTSLPFAKNVNDLSTMLQNETTFKQKFAQLGTTFIPYSQLSNYFRTLNDSLLRETDGTMLEYLKNMIPGETFGSKNLPPKRTAWGKTIEKGSSLPFVPVSETTKDPVILETYKVGYYPSIPGNSISNFELDPKTYDNFLRVSGDVQYDIFNYLIQGDKYKTTNPITAIVSESLFPGSQPADLNNLYVAIKDAPDSLKQDLMTKLHDKINDNIRTNLLGEFIKQQLGSDLPAGQVGEIYAALNEQKMFVDLPQEKKEEMLKDVLATLPSTPSEPQSAVDTE